MFSVPFWVFGIFCRSKGDVNFQTSLVGVEKNLISRPQGVEIFWIFNTFGLLWYGHLKNMVLQMRRFVKIAKISVSSLPHAIDSLSKEDNEWSQAKKWSLDQKLEKIPPPEQVSKVSHPQTKGPVILSSFTRGKTAHPLKYRNPNFIQPAENNGKLNSTYNSSLKHQINR